ncbi:MAG: DUF1926 domain-containing protein [Spirochaetales bacterium]|nr:DUF1926 domain-containing protein [Spirochaetales bacterium]
MKKVKLIFGTYNSQPPEEDNHVVERFYQDAYKTFLTAMYNSSSIKLTLHYSGALFEWIEIKHPEFISVLQEMVNSKQVELLSGGFYDPALTLLPVTDRVGQMEKLTTYIRKNFGKKPRGSFISECVWDASLVSSLKTCGFDYIFLNDYQFLSSGVLPENLAKPVNTEDQGKIVTVLPISTKLTSMFLKNDPKELIDYLRDQQHIDGAFSLIVRGEDLCNKSLSAPEIKAWIEKFNTLLEENSSWIETITPSRFLKQNQDDIDLVYFPQLSVNGMSTKPLPLLCQTELSRLNRHLDALGDVSHWINSGFFKQFLSRYIDSALIYSKMIYINLLSNQIKGDRSRKKTAKEELWRSQAHYVYWHGNHLGIYDKRLREKTYRFLIESEKTTREKGIFNSGVSHYDIDLDGKKETLYQGDVYNAYVSCKGGIIFELDFIKNSRNLLATVMRIEESYHRDLEFKTAFDTYPRKMFHDHFFAPDITPEQFNSHEYKECGNFIMYNYEYDSLNRENNSVALVAKGTVDNLTTAINLSIHKKYKFNKKGLVISYIIENLDDLPIETIFSPEINLSLGDINGKTPPTYSSDKDHYSMSSITKCSGLSNLVIDDVSNSQKINFSFSMETNSFWTIPQYSHSLDNGEIKKFYQFTTLLPLWKIRLLPKKQWTLAVNLSLT